MKTGNYWPRLAQPMGFKASPSAWICVWIWIVSQMSSWINMAIYLQLQLDFHSLLSLLQVSVISSCCFKWAWNSSDNVLIKQTNKQTLLVKKKRQFTSYSPSCPLRYRKDFDVSRSQSDTSEWRRWLSWCGWLLISAEVYFLFTLFWCQRGCLLQT